MLILVVEFDKDVVVVERQPLFCKGICNLPAEGELCRVVGQRRHLIDIVDDTFPV